MATTGNTAAMREALEEICKASQWGGSDFGNPVVKGLLETLSSICRIASEALAAPAAPASEDTSDGYHTFKELYRYRLLYNAGLFNMLAAHTGLPVVKSWKHGDGEPCFGGGWFIVTATLPTGQVSNHYEAKDWPLFRVPEVERAPEWDGHTPNDAADRIEAWLTKGGAEVCDHLRDATQKVGNAAKMREVLEAVKDWLTSANKGPLDALATSQCIPSARIVNDCANGVIRDNKWHIEQIEAALAAPARNCDVGTTRQQEDRFDEFCSSQKVITPHNVLHGKTCMNCMLVGCRRCGIAWAQLPYVPAVPKEGGAE